MQKKQAIIVLGMHRSGTSVAMALAEMQGVYLGNNLFGARADNPKGFFEHADVIDLNEKVFNAFGLHSQDVVPLPVGFENSSEVAPLKKQLTEVLKRDFGESELFGIKDPRMCLLMPLWHKLFSELDIAPQFLIPYRHPAEVAHSLHTRDGISVQHGLLLWLRYNLEILIETEKHPRTLIAFDDLLTKPQECFRQFNLPKKLTIEDAEKFIAKDLRHQKQNNAAEQMPWVMELYNMLPNPDIKRVREIRRDLLAILTPAAEMAIAKGCAEHMLRTELASAKKRKWPWQS